MQRVAVLIVLVGLATTLVLPRRQTPQVIKATGDATRGIMATVMGTGKQV